MTEKKLTCSQQKRIAIMQAADQAFQEQGFQQVSMDNIAKQAKVSKRTIYNHFASKEALFQSIATQVLSRLCDFADIPFSQDQSIAQQLSALIEAEMQILSDIDNINSMRMLMRESMQAPELLQETLQQLKQWDSPIVRWFEQACHAGVLDSDDPRFIAEQLVAVIKGFCLWPQLLKGDPFPEKAQKDKIVARCIDMVIKQYAR